MIYASERDAKLGQRLGSVWRNSGATGTIEVKTEHINCGTAVPTIVIGLQNAMHHSGTSVNFAIPLPFQLAIGHSSVEDNLTTPAEMVNEIRRAFGLSVTQLAAILQIERITVYAWLRTDRMEKLNPSNRQRLWRLFQIARNWSSYAPLSGKYVVEPVPSLGLSVLDLLCAPQLDPGLFAHAYENLARALSPSTRIKRHRLEQKLTLRKGVDNLRKNAGKFGMDLS